MSEAIVKTDFENNWDLDPLSNKNSKPRQSKIKKVKNKLFILASLATSSTIQHWLNFKAIGANPCLRNSKQVETTGSFFQFHEPQVKISFRSQVKAYCNPSSDYCKAIYTKEIPKRYFIRRSFFILCLLNLPPKALNFLKLLLHLCFKF